MSNEQQPTVEDIIKIIDDNYNTYTGSNEAVLHAAEDIFELFKPTSANNAQVELAVQNVTNALPSARDFIGIIHKHLLFHPHSDQIIDCIESYAELVRSNEREKIEKESEMCQCGSERIGSTKLWCCNQCGKRHEKF